MNAQVPAPCECSVDHCRCGVPQSRCVKFHARTAELDIGWCDQCEANTWHANDTCLKITVAEDL